MVQLSATKCNYIAILSVSLVSFAAVTLCVSSQRVFLLLLFISLSTRSENFWIYTLRFCKGRKQFKQIKYLDRMKRNIMKSIAESAVMRK
jgi:hypothetical protein